MPGTAQCCGGVGQINVAAIDPRHALQHLARLIRFAVAVQVHRRLGNVEAQHHADQGGQPGHEEDHAPGVIAPGRCGQRQQRQENGAHGPERFQQHQPAAATVAGQEFRHHRVVHRQRAAHADPRQETQEQQPRELRREGRCHAGAGVDDHGDHQNRTAPDAVGHPAEHERADQHADKEERAALQCLRHGDAEGLGDRRRTETDRQPLHGIRHPDQAKYHEEPILELADTCHLDGLVH
ncbi:hypothetical protein G6F65_016949 [Rhizopus arrhizus]|nr:hypothetical protein G6F65_016949 [Rhizopus arrhizus]